MDNSFAHTTFIPRSTTTNSTYELTQSLYHFYNDEHAESNVQFSIKPFYSRSRKDSKVEQFLTNHGQPAAIREDGSGVFNPEWINLIAQNAEAPYASDVIINRVRQTYGAVFTGFVNVNCNWWIGFNTAVMAARHRTYFCETPTGGPANLYSAAPYFSPNVAPVLLKENANMLDALSNPELEFGRVCCCQKQTQFDDIQFKLGYMAWDCDYYAGSVYGVMTFPLSKMWNNNCVFEPRIGMNNWGIGLGANGDMGLLECHNLHWLWDVKYIWNLPHREVRLFDLCSNGDYSRYLQLVQPQFAQPLPPLAVGFPNNYLGSNILAMDAKVHNRGELNFWTALHYERCGWTAEVAYNLWYRQRQCVEVVKPFAVGEYGIRALGIVPATTASTATINESPLAAAGTAGALVPDTIVVNEVTFPNPIYLSPANINQQSAAHPRSISNTIVGSLGYNADWACHDWYLAINGGYEFGYRENALSGFLVWGTIGVDF